jgi:hypothetical protein
MSQRTQRAILVSAVLFAASSLWAHPHFKKTVTATLPGGAEAKISYDTTPANEDHAKNAAVGAFLTPRRPLLSLSAELMAGGATVPAGDYTIGVVKNGDDDWTLALYPGRLERGDQPDPAKVIKLDSSYSSGAGTAGHMLIDITPGSGKFEGKAVLTLHFGSLFLAGVLS